MNCCFFFDETFFKTSFVGWFFFFLDPYQILGPTSSRLANPGEFIFKFLTAIIKGVSFPSDLLLQSVLDE